MRTAWYLILFGSLIIHHCFTTVSGEGTPAGEAQPSYSQCKPYVDAALKGDIPAEPTATPPPTESQVEKPPDFGGGKDEEDNNTSEGTTEEDDDESKEFPKNPPEASPQSKAESSKVVQEDENNTSEGTTEEDDDESKELKTPAAPSATEAGVEDENNTSEGTTEEDDDESKEIQKKPTETPEAPTAKGARTEDENNTSEGTTEEDDDESKEHKKSTNVETKKDEGDNNDSHEGGEIDDDSKENEEPVYVKHAVADAAAVSASKSEPKSDDSNDNTSEESVEPEKVKAEASKDDNSDSDEDGSPQPVAKDKAKKGAVPSPVADDTDESDSSEGEEKKVEETKKSNKKSETTSSSLKATPPSPPPTAEESSEETAESDSKEDLKKEGDDDDSSEEASKESFIPRSREHITKILGLDDSDSTMETFSMLQKATQTTLKDLKSIYETAIKPLEFLYKYRDLSNRHFGDPEIFSKPLVVFMGPWSGGKSTIINWLLGIQHEENALRTGADPSPAQFNIMMWGEEDEVLDGTQLAADWTFSGLQKFGQNFLDRLRGRKLPTRLLEKVNLVEIPGILEIRKQVERSFPFNDACQWFIDRADLLFLVYDPAKLDIGPETEAILDQLKGRENQVRIILNKADTVKPEELLRVQATLVWNISPLMSSSEPPILYAASLWERPFLPDSPVSLLTSHENLFLKDIRDATEKRVETRIAAARRFAVRVRNHAKMCDCYLNTYNNHRSFFSNKKKISDDIVDHPQNYHIYEGLSTLTNISRYDLPDPDTYRDFFRLNPLWEFPTLASTCTYFRGCPINKLDIAIAYDLPELLGRFRRQRESILAASNQPRVNIPGTPPKAGSKWKIEVIEPPAPPPSATTPPKNRWKKDVEEDLPSKAPTPTPSSPPSTGQKNKWKKDLGEEVVPPPPAVSSPAAAAQKNRWKKDVEETPTPEAAPSPAPAAPKNKWKKDVEEEVPPPAAAATAPIQAAPKNKWKKDVEEVTPPITPEPVAAPPAAPKNRWKKE